MQAHEITTDAAGVRHGTDGVVTVSLLDSGGTMLKRRAIKGVGSAQSHEVSWLVCELNGVRVYQCGNSVIITEQDLYP